MSYLSQIMIVGAGGFIGSAMRFAVGGWVQRLATTSVMPWGTLAVNVLGCLAIGFLGGIAEYRQALEPGQRLFLMVGILGGFTTFSAFAIESIALMHGGELVRALINTLAQIVLGFGAAFTGYFLARVL